jgi:hypothetical protein
VKVLGNRARLPHIIREQGPDVVLVGSQSTRSATCPSRTYLSGLLSTWIRSRSGSSFKANGS